MTVPGGNREPDEEYMQGGILPPVTYPTGGRAEFTYEAHRYAVAGSSRPAGGLRIRSGQGTAASGRAGRRPPLEPAKNQSPYVSRRGGPDGEYHGRHRIPAYKNG